MSSLIARLIKDSMESFPYNGRLGLLLCSVVTCTQSLKFSLGKIQYFQQNSIPLYSLYQCQNSKNCPNMLIFCPSWSCTIIYYIIIFTSLCNIFTYVLEVFSRSFSMPCASFSMLDGPGETGCDVPVHSSWDSRDVIMTAVFDIVSKSVWDL